MSVLKEPNGRRSVQVEVEVPGTPEEVWQAIATGPGVSSWFVPSEIDARVGGKIKSTFGPGMDAFATITAIDAPRRFTAESENYMPGGPPMATEWTVEARDGGTCVVRVMHSLFASTDDWDNQLEGTESGWPAFFLILRMYLSRFVGQPCSRFHVVGIAAQDIPSAWSSLKASLGWSATGIGAKLAAHGGAPRMAGQVEAAGEGNHPFTLLVLDQPAPGAAFLNVCGMGDKSMASVIFYLYGATAAAAAAEAEPLWQSWLSTVFPAPQAAGQP